MCVGPKPAAADDGAADEPAAAALEGRQRLLAETNISVARVRLCHGMCHAVAVFPS
jgi:hypothetical protein